VFIHLPSQLSLTGNSNTQKTNPSKLRLVINKYIAAVTTKTARRKACVTAAETTTLGVHTSAGQVRYRTARPAYLAEITITNAETTATWRLLASLRHDAGDCTPVSSASRATLCRFVGQLSAIRRRLAVAARDRPTDGFEIGLLSALRRHRRELVMPDKSSRGRRRKNANRRTRTAQSVYAVRICYVELVGL